MNAGSLGEADSDFFSTRNSGKLTLYDTTLRDGAQTPNVNLNLEDKLGITQKLSDFGIHYIEGGWPSSSPRDREYFRKVRELDLKAKIAAFGMTSKSPGNDRNTDELVRTQSDAVTVFGKSWDMHARDVLKVGLERNLQMISETIDFLRQSGFRDVFYDAEHFFDGYKENPGYALETLAAARKADCIILCDTNGGSMPWEVYSIMKKVSESVRNPLGIHSHNDSGLALANSLQALDFAGHVQGTVNGLGERCGNLDLCEFIPTVQLKMGMKVVERLEGLKELSGYVERLTGFSIPKNSPFVGENAFRHKAGVHVDGVMKNPRSYEHIPPETVGNERAFMISEQSGRSGILVAARKFGYALDKEDARVIRILDEVKRRKRFSEAELFILLARWIDGKKEPFELLDYRTSVSKDGSAESSVEVRIGKEVLHEISKGVGPVHSLDMTIRKALKRFFDIESVRLTNYKVRILNEERATAAIVEVLIEFRANGENWYTIASSDDVIKASEEALVDGYKYYLLKQSK